MKISTESSGSRDWTQKCSSRRSRRRFGLDDPVLEARAHRLAHRFAGGRLPSVTCWPGRAVEIRLLSCVLMGSACLPREDLSSYTGGTVAVVSNTPDASTDPPPAPAPPDPDDSDPEVIEGPLPVDDGEPSDRTDAGSDGPSRADAAPVSICQGPGEFASAVADSCYLLSSEPVLWLEARSACRAWGGDLVSIESAFEDAFLTDRFASNTWIGANDRAQEGTMVWSTGVPVVYTNWSEQQPDDFMGGEDCIEKWISDGQWNDRPCDGNAQPYLCER